MAPSSVDGAPAAPSFTIEFDERRAAAHGATADGLYDRVGACVEPYGNVRVARGTWRAREGADGFWAQPVALARLTRERWVMQSVGSITYREGGVEGDYLDVIRRVRPAFFVSRRGQTEGPDGTPWPHAAPSGCKM